MVGLCILWKIRFEFSFFFLLQNIKSNFLRLYLNTGFNWGVKSWFIFIVLLVLLFLTHMKYVNKRIYDVSGKNSTHSTIYCTLEKMEFYYLNSMDLYNGFLKWQREILCICFNFYEFFFVTHILNNMYLRKEHIDASWILTTKNLWEIWNHPKSFLSPSFTANTAVEIT